MSCAAILLFLMAGLVFPLARRYTGPAPAEDELAALEDLFDAGKLADVLTRCQLDHRNSSLTAIEPEICYIEWAADRRLGRLGAAAAAKQELLNRFPRNPLTADVYFDLIWTHINEGRMDKVDEEICTIELRWPDGAANVKARALKAKLADFKTTHAPETGGRHQSGGQ